MMKSRKQRKLEAKQNRVPFVPQYNGNGVVSFEDYYGVGNERFNNKFVKFLKSSEMPIEQPEDNTTNEHPVINDNSECVNVAVEEIVDEVVEAELVVEQPKKKKGKFKKALKKLFNK